MTDALQAATELLRQLVEIESPTGHVEGVRAVAERVAAELEQHGAETRFRGDHLLAELDGEGEPLLVVGHTDTVWPLGTLESMPFRVNGDRAHGPGAFDMKGGLAVLVAAVAETKGGRRPLRILLTADESRAAQRPAM